MAAVWSRLATAATTRRRSRCDRIEDVRLCGEASDGSWIELRLYDGPGLKVGELQLDVCERHLQATRTGYDQPGGLVAECRVTRWERARSE